jgi:hypothetical protein
VTDYKGRPRTGFRFPINTQHHIPQLHFQLLTMATSPVSKTVSSTSTMGRTGTRNTGFPEPFSDARNTTLPHPEAVTQPGEELDVSVITTPTKNRRKLLSNKRGRYMDDNAGMVGDVQYADEKVETHQRKGGIMHKLEEKLHLRKGSDGN